MEIGLGMLHLTPEQFWGMTLPEFFAAWKGYSLTQDQADFRAGLIAAVFANAHRDRSKQPLTPADFFPHLTPDEAPPPKPQAETNGKPQYSLDEQVALLKQATSREGKP